MKKTIISVLMAGMLITAIPSVSYAQVSQEELQAKYEETLKLVISLLQEQIQMLLAQLAGLQEQNATQQQQVNQQPVTPAQSSNPVGQTAAVAPTIASLEVRDSSPWWATGIGGNCVATSYAVSVKDSNGAYMNNESVVFIDPLTGSQVSRVANNERKVGDNLTYNEAYFSFFPQKTEGEYSVKFYAKNAPEVVSTITLSVKEVPQSWLQPFDRVEVQTIEGAEHWRMNHGKFSAWINPITKVCR
jgi:hypothetical protein